MSKKLCKAIKGLDKVIAYHEDKDAEELIDMGTYTHCALGQYVESTIGRRLNAHYEEEATKHIFGSSFVLDMPKDYKKKSVHRRLSKLFGAYNHMKSTDLTRKVWLKDAKKVRRKLEMDLEAKLGLPELG